MTDAFTPEAQATRLLLTLARERLALIDRRLAEAEEASAGGELTQALGGIYGLDERLTSLSTLLSAVRTTINAKE